MTDSTSRVFPPTLAELELAAEAAADPAAWAYLAHGSGDESTMRDNVAAWTKWKLLPQVLRDMGDVRTSTTVLGIDVDAPILIAPTAMHRFVSDDGELATATAAARANTIYVVSMAATTSLALNPRQVGHAALTTLALTSATRTNQTGAGVATQSRVKPSHG